jgi:hypothetical protein
VDSFDYVVSFMTAKYMAANFYNFYLNILFNIESLRFYIKNYYDIIIH